MKAQAQKLFLAVLCGALLCVLAPAWNAGADQDKNMAPGVNACTTATLSKYLNRRRQEYVRKVFRVEAGQAERGSFAVLRLAPSNIDKIFSHPIKGLNKNSKDFVWAKAVVYTDRTKNKRTHAVFFSQQDPKAINSLKSIGSSVHHRDVISNFLFAESHYSQVKGDYESAFEIFEEAEKFSEQRNQKFYQKKILKRSQGFQFTAERQADGSLQITKIGVDSSITSAQIKNGALPTPRQLAAQIRFLLDAMDPAVVSPQFHTIEIAGLDAMAEQGFDVERLHELLQDNPLHRDLDIVPTFHSR